MSTVERYCNKLSEEGKQGCQRREMSILNTCSFKGAPDPSLSPHYTPVKKALLRYQGTETQSEQWT